MQTGSDDRGTLYPSIEEMWQVQLHAKPTNIAVHDPVGSKDNWYSKANDYWSNTQASYDGVLGGYGKLSGKDLHFSLGFLLDVVKMFPNFQRGSVLDCGAGIGRISNELLCQTFKQVDLVDQCPKYVAKAKELLKQKTAARHFYCTGLQQFEFSQRYDCVWIQWVLSQLSDEDAISFLKKAKSALNETGIIILKENHCKYGFVVDKQDYSVTRSKQLYKQIINKAGLKVVIEKGQADWPADLFQLHMYAIC